MRYAICNELFEGWPWERVCEYAASLGYTGIEIAPFTLADHADEITPAKRQEIRQTARKHGMEIIGLHWLLVKPPGFYITSPDAAIRKMTCAYFRSLISLCADLGGNVLVIGSPKQRTLLPGVSRELAMQYAVEVFGGVIKEAMLREVVLAIEPLSPKLTDFLNTAEEGIELIQHINHPNFRLHLDVSAMQTEPTPGSLSRQRFKPAWAGHGREPHRLSADSEGTERRRLRWLAVSGSVRLPPRRGGDRQRKHSKPKT